MNANPIITAIDRMLVDQEQRHSDIIRAGEQIREWKQQELEQSSRGGGTPNKLPPIVK